MWRSGQKAIEIFDRLYREAGEANSDSEANKVITEIYDFRDVLNEIEKRRHDGVLDELKKYVPTAL